jgi:hypothetical protein
MRSLGRLTSSALVLVAGLCLLIPAIYWTANPAAASSLAANTPGVRSTENLPGTQWAYELTSQTPLAQLSLSQAATRIAVLLRTTKIPNARVFALLPSPTQVANRILVDLPDQVRGSTRTEMVRIARQSHLKLASEYPYVEDNFLNTSLIGTQRPVIQFLRGTSASDSLQDIDTAVLQALAQAHARPDLFVAQRVTVDGLEVSRILVSFTTVSKSRLTPAVTGVGNVLAKDSVSASNTELAGVILNVQ